MTLEVLLNHKWREDILRSGNIDICNINNFNNILNNNYYNNYVRKTHGHDLELGGSAFFCYYLGYGLLPLDSS